MTNVQIAIGFRRETGMNTTIIFSCLNFFFNNLVNKIIRFHRIFTFNRIFAHYIQFKESLFEWD